MNYQYFGLFLNEHNRNELMKIIFANPIIANLVLQRGSTLYLDHCTLLHRNQNDKEIYDSLVKKIDESWMVESISKRTSFYKDGIVYQKPHIILEFSERHDESIYFDSDEEMEGWLESFRQEFGKPFIYIE